MAVQLRVISRQQLLKSMAQLEAIYIALDRVCLEPNCTVTGNIHYSNMEMRSGAQLVGSCNYQQMTPAKEIPSQTAVKSEKVKEIRNNNQQSLDKQWQ